MRLFWLGTLFGVFWTTQMGPFLAGAAKKFMLLLFIMVVGWSGTLFVFIAFLGYSLWKLIAYLGKIFFTAVG